MYIYIYTFVICSLLAIPYSPSSKQSSPSLSLSSLRNKQARAFSLCASEPTGSFPPMAICTYTPRRDNSKGNIINICRAPFNTNRVNQFILISMNCILIKISLIYISICFGDPKTHLRHFEELCLFFQTCIFGKDPFWLIFVNM